MRSALPLATEETQERPLLILAIRNRQISRIVSRTEVSQVPVRIPTEAEWEFAACSQQQHILFSTCNDLEVCSDWFASFESIDYAIDPTGPSKGKNHVTRSFSRMESKFYRIYVGYYGFGNKRYDRLVVKARDVVR